MKPLSHRQVKNKLKKLMLFMEHDIQSAIDGNANYLAHGLISYTEVIGGLIRGTLKKGNSRDNFEAFMAFFHKEYSGVNSRMIKDKMMVYITGESWILRNTWQKVKPKYSHRIGVSEISKTV